jgi:RNA polymerase sigma-70 factor (ECF subfamily)
MALPFSTTRWSLVLRAGEWKQGADGAPTARAAMEELIGAYWQPLYAFARSRGGARAADLVQGFFARAVEKGGLVPRERSARFRAFLLAAFQHFCANEHARATALKRGGDASLLNFGELCGREESALVSRESPELAFERRFAQRVLERALDRLREEQERAGKQAQFHSVLPHLTGDDDAAPILELARQVGTTEGALKVALHRLRRRYGEIRATRSPHARDPQRSMPSCWP